MSKTYLFYLGSFAAATSSSVLTWMLTENYWYNKVNFDNKPKQKI